jgi:alkylhydroperoxidase/carboxymuconolactone decarboxylase family protein YurZ
MDEVERLLRLLALNDEQSLDRVLGSRADAELSPGLDPKVDLLIRLGALLAVGASTSSLRATVERAIAAGATPAEVTDVLVAVAPAVGMARVVSGAPRLAAALGYEIDRDD